MMFDNDYVCRLALFPKFKSRLTDIFDVETFLSFHKMEDGKWYAMSVGNRFLLKTSEDVHAYGCRAAGYANETFAKRNGRQPASFDEQTHYIGFYDLRWGGVRDAPSLYYDITIRWKFENGEQAHFQIELIRKRGIQASDKQRRDDRTAVAGVMGMLLEGPARHVCGTDEEHRDYLEAIYLPELSLEAIVAPDT